MSEYKKKRDFSKTPEPRWAKGSESKKRFVVQKHDATNLHFDFRLELPETKDSENVVLKSWALPKGAPEKENEKRLAIETEDHPVSYIDFEGEIPEGNYGAGKVEIWDRGFFDLIKRDEKVIEIILKGDKLGGRYSLVKTGYQKNGWLLIKNAPK